MRAAKVEDTWRALLRKPAKVSLRSIQISNSPFFKQQEVSFPPVAAIVGRNGVWKSTLLRIIANICEGKKFDDLPYLRAKLTAAEVSVAFERDGKLYKNKYSEIENALIAEGSEKEVYLCDPSKECRRLISDYTHQENFSELLDASEERIFAQIDLDKISWVVGRKYEAVSVWEVESYQDIDSVTPYFRVQADGVFYGAESMGLGELVCFYMGWYLDNLVDPGILLLEEPESYLSPRSQLALMNMVALTCLTKNLSLCVATHSPHVLSHFPADSILVANAVLKENALEISTHANQSLMVLGMTPIKRCVAFVEDFMAKVFLEEIVGFFDPWLLSELEIVELDGKDEVIRMAPRLYSKVECICHVGVLDGDANDKKFDNNFALSFLPGTSPPEDMLIKYCFGDPEAVSEQLSRKPENVKLAFGHILGVNLHDKIPEFSDMVGCSVSDVTYAFIRVWLGNEGNQEMAMQTFLRFKRGLKR